MRVLGRGSSRRHACCPAVHIARPRDSSAAVQERESRQAALGLALAARLLPFLYGWEHYGDAPVRIELAERWARAPHLWRGFLEAYQYGPLQLTVLGLIARVLPGRFVGPRLLSFAAGMLSVWLLWRITLRLAEPALGPTAALVAACGLALSPLAIQSSTTGASEALFLALLLGAIAMVLDGAIVVPALLLGAACLVRYDGLLYVGLISLLWLRELGLFRSAALFLIATAPMLFWLWLNYHYTGDALAPIHHIDQDHRELAAMGLHWFGSCRYRAYCLAYWPIAVCGIATPVLGLAALSGAARALWTRSSDGARIVALAWIPAAYFTFRGAVLADFRPMSRFALVAATLSLPFAWSILQRFGRATLALTFLVLVATPVALAAVSWNRNGSLAEWARPLSPISSLPPGVEDAALWLRANAGADDFILVEGVWDYLDVPLIFAAHLPDDQWIREAWTTDFEARLLRHTPTLAVLLYQGNLHNDRRASPSAVESSLRFTFAGVDFCRQASFVYASIYRRCPR